MYKQFFSGRTERYVQWSLVENDVIWRSEPAEKKRQEMSAMLEDREDLWTLLREEKSSLVSSKILISTTHWSSHKKFLNMLPP